MRNQHMAFITYFPRNTTRGGEDWQTGIKVRWKFNILPSNMLFPTLDKGQTGCGKLRLVLNNTACTAE